MLGVTVFGLVLTPVFYSAVRRFAGRQPDPAAGMTAATAATARRVVTCEAENELLERSTV